LQQLARTAGQPSVLSNAYADWSKQVDACAQVVSADRDWANQVGFAVKVKMQESLGEITSDYLSQMELVEGVHGDRGKALESWRMWALVALGEVKDSVHKQ
jgi:hypothetical protein